MRMRKAFFDLIEKALSEEQPDPEWITRLYAEMRDKLCALTPRRTDMHKEIPLSLLHISRGRPTSPFTYMRSASILEHNHNQHRTSSHQ